MNTPHYVVTYDKTPEYLMTGKRYPVQDISEDTAPYLVSIRDDEGDGVLVLSRRCAHLDQKGNWKLGFEFNIDELRGQR